MADIMNSIERLEDGSRWSLAFEIDGRDHVFESRLLQMMPRPSDVFTAKLQVTRAWLNSVEAGTVHPLRASMGQGLPSFIEVIRLLSAHDRIARTGDFRLSHPGFWVRRNVDAGFDRPITRPRPVMPIIHLSHLSGLDVDALNHVLRLLHEDGVVSAMRNQDGTSGVLLNAGFVSDSLIKGLLPH